MAKPKILMLGWHFQAQISGGMGVASYQIARSIAEKTDLTIFLPSYDPQKYPINASIIDFSQIDYKKKKSRLVNHVHLFTINESLIISPYQRIEKAASAKRETTETIPSRIQAAVEDYNNIMVEMGLKEDFDIIYCHDWMTFAAGIALKNLTGKKLVVHLHSLEYDRNHNDSWIFGLERKAMDMADVVICVSNYSKEIARKHYNIYSGKISTIYNGISEINATETSEKNTRQVVTFAGRLTKQKGIDSFVAIASKIYNSLPEVQFVIAGEGELKDEIKDFIASLPGNENFHLLGFLEKEELQQLFSGSDVFCLPSVSEPFGLVALEAASQGVACVISKQSGVSEILLSSLQSDAHDLDGFADQIISLLKDAHLKETIVRNQQKEMSSFVWTKTADDILELFQKVIN